MWLYLSSGFVLGFTAGVAPGPLLALVISQTVTYGVKDGIKIALAPLITDPPIIFIAFLLGTQFVSAPLPLGILSLAGAVYIFYMAWDQLTTRLAEEPPSGSAANSVRKGVLTNLLNPHPYIFWITVGIPFILKTWATGPWGAMVWLLIFYIMLVGSKIGLALIADRSRQWIHGAGYVWLNRILGLLLLIFALKLATDGIALIKLPSIGG